MSNKELTTKIERLQDMKADIDRHQKEADALADIIKAELVKRDLDELATATVRVTYRTVNSSRFDSTAFKTAHARLYAAFLKATETRRFVVTAI